MEKGRRWCVQEDAEIQKFKEQLLVRTLVRRLWSFLCTELPTRNEVCISSSAESFRDRAVQISDNEIPSKSFRLTFLNVCSVIYRDLKPVRYNRISRVWILALNQKMIWSPHHRSFMFNVRRITSVLMFEVMSRFSILVWQRNWIKAKNLRMELTTLLGTQDHRDSK